MRVGDYCRVWVVRCCAACCYLLSLIVARCLLCLFCWCGMSIVVCCVLCVVFCSLMVDNCLLFVVCVFVACCLLTAFVA